MERDWIAQDREAYAAEVTQADLEDRLALELKPFVTLDESIQVASDGHAVQQWFIENACIKQDGRFLVNLDFVGVVPCFDIGIAVAAVEANLVDKQAGETLVSGESKVYALVVGTTAASLVIMPPALFDVREIVGQAQRDIVASEHGRGALHASPARNTSSDNSPAGPAAVAHAREMLPSLLLDLLEDEDTKKVVHGDALGLSQKIASDLSVDAVGFVDIRNVAKAAGEGEVAMVDPKHATLQEMMAAYHLEYLPKLDEGRRLFLPKLSSPAKLSDVRILGQRAMALARLMATLS